MSFELKGSEWLVSEGKGMIAGQQTKETDCLAYGGDSFTLFKTIYHIYAFFHF